MSSYARKQWAEGLIFLWTSIEQVINIIWRQEVLSRVSKDNIDGRTNFLKDFRTWTTSAKIELLYQKEYLGGDEYKLLNIARKARNDFVHNALALGAEKVKAALEVLFRLISLVVSDYKSATEMEAVLTSIHNNQREDLYPKKTVFEPYEVTHWRYLPPLPGDNAWEGDYEIIDELVIHPLKSD